MKEMVVQHKISDSPELKLLRQDNLAFYAEINARAFSESASGEVPRATYLRIVDAVKADFVAVLDNEDFSREARYYLDVMLGRFASYDPARTQPWVGTETRDGTEMVVLLEPAARVIRILSEIGSDQGFIATSSLSSLTERVSRVVARLSGDETRQIEELETRKREIEAEIAQLKARGAQPMTDRERQTEIGGLLADIARIRAGFSEVPGARRRINRENQELFLETDAAPGAALDVFWERQKAWEQSGEAAILESLRHLYTDVTRSQLTQASLEIIARDCADILAPQDRARVAGFLPDMLEISNDISIEIAGIWRSVRAYLSSPDYTARREESRALKAADEAIARVRNELRPSPRDTRLREVGLALTMPLRTSPLTDLRLTLEPPEGPAEARKNAPAARDAAEEEARTRRELAEENARSLYLGVRSLKARIADAMGEAESVTLAEVLRRFPPRYGRHEIACYLDLAASQVPSSLAPGNSFVIRLTERGRVSAANVPNPVFHRSGPIGKGFEAHAGAEHLLHPRELRRLGATPDPREIPDVAALRAEIALAEDET